MCGGAGWRGPQGWDLPESFAFTNFRAKRMDLCSVRQLILQMGKQVQQAPYLLQDTWRGGAGASFRPHCWHTGVWNDPESGQMSSFPGPWLGWCVCLGGPALIQPPTIHFFFMVPFTGSFLLQEALLI